jgi:putative tricarboxylic transport membrane protein
MESDLFSITIDFEQSHLFFPAIVQWVLLLLLLAIFLIYGPGYVRDVRAGKKKLPFRGIPFDKLRFFGTLVLTVVYFLSMDVVGEIFPNQGLGFLIMSIPFLFVLSLLYVHGLTRRKLAVIGLTSLIAPSIAWHTLANLFNISLP